MSHLSKALTKYYCRTGYRIAFKNVESITLLSTLMDMNLGGRGQIEPGVLSRVLTGKRFFTKKQLGVFCYILEIPSNEREILFNCLNLDLTERSGVSPINSSSSVNDTLEIISDVEKQAYKLLYEGTAPQLKDVCTIVGRHIVSLNKHTLNASQKIRIYELLATNLYLQGRYYGCAGIPEKTVQKVTILTSKLDQINKVLKRNFIQGWIDLLLADAYYVSGGYANNNLDKNVFIQSMEYAKSALAYFGETDHDRLFALRLIAANASYLEDRDSSEFVLKATKESLFKQPLENRVQALHLCGTIAKVSAKFGAKDPFEIKEKAIEYFKRDLTRSGTFEVSDIKTEVETRLLISKDDREFIKNKIFKGMILSEQGSLIRHEQRFKQLLSTL